MVATQIVGNHLCAGLWAKIGFVGRAAPSALGAALASRLGAAKRTEECRAAVDGTAERRSMTLLLFLEAPDEGGTVFDDSLTLLHVLHALQRRTEQVAHGVVDGALEVRRPAEVPRRAHLLQQEVPYDTTGQRVTDKAMRG